MPNSTIVRCTNCGAGVPASSVNIQAMVAVCPECNHMFRLENTAKQLELSAQRKIKPPDTFDVLETDHELHISFRLIKNLTGLEVISYGFTTVGLIIGLAFTLAMIVAGELVLSLLAAVYVGFILYYSSLALLNTRRIVMDEETICWFDEPVWMPVKRSFEIREIDHIGIQPSRGAATLNAKGYFELVVHHADGTSELFLDYLPRRKAVYLQQVLEARLLERYGERDESPFMEVDERAGDSEQEMMRYVDDKSQAWLSDSH